ncbi:hypothetical protein HLB44_09715 [Aquincola sp. S2]|uniref:Type III secretion protein n=1 Tax=Pseudaquabacterium terrae TaxID=2732868 RepID=A0ABX2EF66_9BURK|nr:hypothetical protein [Aquabacterium terrae]NRF67259.1 hypothetical protein [Aquabacterium terrae]
MSFEIAAAAALGPSAAGAASAASPVQVGYGVSLTDIGSFQQALAGAQARLEAQPVQPTSEVSKQLMTPFEHINSEAAKLSSQAQAATAGGRDMSPSDVVLLTMRCQEFMFHCQLTSNIANRTSDGLQQLFRQQA